MPHMEGVGIVDPADKVGNPFVLREYLWFLRVNGEWNWGCYSGSNNLRDSLVHWNIRCPFEFTREHLVLNRINPRGVISLGDGGHRARNVSEGNFPRLCSSEILRINSKSKSRAESAAGGIRPHNLNFLDAHPSSLINPKRFGALLIGSYRLICSLNHFFPLAVSDSRINAYDDECHELNGKSCPFPECFLFVFGYIGIFDGWYRFRLGMCHWRWGIGVLLRVCGVGCGAAATGVFQWDICQHANTVP